MVLGTNTGVLHVDLTKNQVVNRIECASKVRAMLFIPDWEYLYVCTGLQLKAMKVTQKEILKLQTKEFQSTPNCLSFCSQQQKLAVGFSYGSPNQIVMCADQQVVKQVTDNSETLCLAWSPYLKNVLAKGSYDGSVKIIEDD